uniref:LITAF domain-containing protein n=1 Tax=Strigamia maritima TaxID=126957 RepID=T1JEW1_STRMM
MEYPKTHTNFPSAPYNTVCPRCGTTITTSAKYQFGLCTWLACGILFLTGIGAAFCCLPFFIKSCKDVDHTCPSCNTHIGTLTRL